MQAYSTFIVEGVHFGVRTSEVIEFTKGLEVTPIPLGPPVVAGFMNLRGQIVTAIDIRKQLNLSGTRDDETTIGIFFRHEGSLYSLLVDEVHDILELADEQFEPPPSSLQLSARDVVAGVYKLPKRLLVIIDPHKIVSSIYQHASTK